MGAGTFCRLVFVIDQLKCNSYSSGISIRRYSEGESDTNEAHSSKHFYLNDCDDSEANMCIKTINPFLSNLTLKHNFAFEASAVSILGNIFGNISLFDLISIF